MRFYGNMQFLVGKSKNNRVTDKESKDFGQRIESKSPELIAIYGRRRIGKTYLVRQYLNDTFSFYSTGIYIKE